MKEQRAEDKTGGTAPSHDINRKNNNDIEVYEDENSDDDDDENDDDDDDGEDELAVLTGMAPSLRQSKSNKRKRSALHKDKSLIPYAFTADDVAEDRTGEGVDN
uniref:Uncharacterized protein n=1 Tax=Lygus hesperus TaxID=30085 RepID=A0A0A9X2V8_LYGHE